jgi:hypothetical protein
LTNNNTSLWSYTYGRPEPSPPTPHGHQHVGEDERDEGLNREQGEPEDDESDDVPFEVGDNGERAPPVD